MLPDQIAPVSKPTSSALSMVAVGSLAQSARFKRLKIARRILLTVGILTVGFNLLVFSIIGLRVDRSLDALVAGLTHHGHPVDGAKLERLKGSETRAAQLMTLGVMAVGMFYIVLSCVIKTFPVLATISALVIYVGTTIVFTILAPKLPSIYQLSDFISIALKLAIIVALFKAVQAAMGYQNHVNYQIRSSLTGTSE